MTCARCGVALDTLLFYVHGGWWCGPCYWRVFP